jgi:hypothetical protein
MLAIDYETGKLIWQKQFTADDIFTIYSPGGPDYDIGSSANLFSVDGKELLGIGLTVYGLQRPRLRACPGSTSTAGGRKCRTIFRDYPKLASISATDCCILYDLC